jgi:serine phosphatase RsbU (regulator of sigma subunit)
LFHGVVLSQNIITGVVVNERSQPQARVKISVNKSPFTITNKDGKFDLEIKSAKPKLVEIQKAGFEVKKWDFSEEKGLSVIISAVEKTYSGRAELSDGKPAQAKELVFYFADFNFSAKTDNAGNFSLAIPGDVLLAGMKEIKSGNQKVSFKISADNQLLLTFDKKNDAKKEEQLLSRTVTLQFLENDQALENVEFSLDGIKVKTNKEGQVKVPRGALSKVISAKYKIVKIDSTGNDFFILKLTANAQTKELIEGNFNEVIAKLEYQKQEAVAQNAVIYAKINEINETLKSNPNLSSDERKQLRGTLLRLEGQVNLNNKAFEEAQKKTTALIDMLRNTLEQKDSVSLAAQERIKVIEIEKERERIEAQRNIIIISSIAAVLAFASFAFYTILQKVKKQKAEIVKQAQTLTELNQLIVLKNVKITDSIRYAQTIQQAVLPDDERMRAVSENYFVVFKPKDIVSGDFYWVSDTNRSRDVLVACVDCTGHGVSGAFMSLIANTLLNQIVNQDGITDTAEILEKLDAGIRKSLKQEQKANKDGMDLAICKFMRNEENVRVCFTGAKRPLFIVRKAAQEVEILKGDLRSIGGDRRRNREFTVQETVLKNGDIVYLMTDGFVDQSSENKDKFGTKKLLEILPETAKMTLSEQKSLFENLLEKHKGEEEQRDDISVLAFKF